jgi:DNA ligase-1
MKAFANLYSAIDSTNKTSEKVKAIVAYLETAPPEDAIWALSFLMGRRPKRSVNSTKMQAWASEVANVPAWLFGECYDAVGDLAETISLILPDSIHTSADIPLHRWVTERLIPLAKLDEPVQRTALIGYWNELDPPSRFVLNKLITGAFRVGVSQDLVIRAMSLWSGVPAPVVAHRLMGDWQTDASTFARLTLTETEDSDVSRPYPFCLAHPIEGDIETLGNVADWQIEWKWDGIRAQLIRRQGETFLWSRGEELMTDRFPEVSQAAAFLPDGTVIDGEILAWQGDKPLKFLELQRRIGRKIVSKKILTEVPVKMVAFDLLEFEGIDCRELPISGRRELLEKAVAGIPDSIVLSPLVLCDTWKAVADSRQESRTKNVEGFMLKRKDSPYLVGRKKGFWWKWKIDPFTVDAVLIYAARGSGKRASLYTDYTFGVWDGDRLVSFAKAYSGLTDEEIRKVDAWVRRNTAEKFGPVRTVTPELVFELAFEAIQLSNRHKSGVAVRFPRILRWRTDKKKEEADSLQNIKSMLLAEPS